MTGPLDPPDLSNPAQAAGEGRASAGEAADHLLQLRWSESQSGRDFAQAVASFLLDPTSQAVLTTTSGDVLDELELDECVALLRRNAVASLVLRFPLLAGPARWEVRLDLSTGPNGGSSCALVTTAPERQAMGLRWLQASLDHLPPLPLLALPVGERGVTRAAFHAFVVLATHCGRPESAELFHQPGPASRTTVARWWFDQPPRGAIPVFDHEGAALWLATAEAPAPGAPPVCWFEELEAAPVAPPAPPSPDLASWTIELDRLLAAEAPDPDRLIAHLRGLAPAPVPVRLAPRAGTPPLETMAPRQDGVLCTVVPTEHEVVIGLDLGSPTNRTRAALLHAYAHVRLGHVRPGDPYGHWDTAQTIEDERPHRRWDREVREHCASWFAPPPARRVESLEECTPTEKAQLGLWRMVGELLGESRRLHPRAEQYQPAVYQRQAAQRIVAMLEDYQGAMLCDGVGLGKTYIGTTVIVHYVNTWQELHRDVPDLVRTDPFRISVLAPNSVVSTWRREAIPPLSAFGVPGSSVRIISHTKLSRMTAASELLEPGPDGAPSDLEHLLLSDLVLVDEAHNFRSLAARRTKVLRDLLRLQPRREVPRRVVLLTATPVNNSLDDLRQEAGLLFSRPLYLSEAKTDDGYRRQASKEVRDRLARARSGRTRGDVAGLVVHGQADARFSDALEFRDDLDFGENVQRIGDYLREQDQRLQELQTSIRDAAQQTSARPASSNSPVRIAEELLDRIVVQRSRALCKEIERQQGSNVELLFRPDAGVPEQLRYSDEYDGIQDVLARFLPLFDGARETSGATARRLSLKVYMWYDVREGRKDADEQAPVVGLQRVLVLKRLESSPVSFLLTLLRLTVLHAHRLQQLGNLCLAVGAADRHRTLQAELETVLSAQPNAALAKLRTLATGASPPDPRTELLQALSAAYAADRPEADTDDPPPQLTLFTEEEGSSPQREQLDRLWPLYEALVADLATLFAVTPELADIVFGKFARTEWPRRFLAGGEAIDWPHGADWGLRLVTDPKVRRLVGRLVLARRAQQKVIVFSQFADTIAYVRSVLAATQHFERADWQMAVRGLGVAGLTSQEVVALREATAAITGETEGRDDRVNAFAPFYRIGPWRPPAAEANEAERTVLCESWETAWTLALTRPVDVLLSSDVLAEGVNLQDAALLINFDVHWNPVRMIQRSGRIDRRLNPRIEQPREFPDLAALAARLNKPVPRYYWHDHPTEAPVTVNLILPDELEAELQLRERIATKTLAIDFTLGLEQGTGAEADWMANYQYHGITSLNSFQKDRAIEQLASHHERLTRRFAEFGVKPEWCDRLNGWFRGRGADHGSPLVARALIGLLGGEPVRFWRYLEPVVMDRVPHWFWAEQQPGESMFDGWLVLDGQSWPPLAPRRDIPWHERVAGPVKPSHLLAALECLEREGAVVEWSAANKGVGRLLLQGASALAAPKFGEDRPRIRIPQFFILQLESFEPVRTQAASRAERAADRSRDHGPTPDPR